jgi:hypothetical protein
MERLTSLLSFFLVLLVACSAQPRPEVFSDPDPGSVVPVATSTPEGVHSNNLGTSPESQMVETESLGSPPYLGIHISDYSSPEQLSFFINSGAKWSRYSDFHWDLIEPVPQTPSVYDWSSIDETSLATASGMGIDSIGIILFTPTYAQKYPGSVCGPIAEDQLERFSQFLHALVTRYSQPPYNLKYWELGNEPDVDYAYANRHGFGCWGDPNDPYFGGGYYATMLKYAYPMIKAADPQAQVLLGGLLLDCDPRNPPETSQGSGELKDCRSSLFLDGILENGGGDYFDGISFHAYDYYSFKDGKYTNLNWHSRSDANGPVAISKMMYLRERLEAYGIPEKYILNTESALICGRDGMDQGCLTSEFANTKAAYTVHSNTMAYQMGLKANIWYSLMGWRASELLDKNYTPLPAYEAYRVNSGMLADAVFRRQVLDHPNMFIYEFETGSGYLWILWSRSGEMESLVLPVMPVEVYDIYGNQIPASQEINVNYSPIYIKFTSQ